MKLLAKTSLYYLLCSIPVLIIAALINYFMLASVVERNNDDYFQKRKSIVKNYIEQNDTIALRIYLQNGEASVTPVSNNYNIDDIYCDTLLFDKFEGDLADVQMLSTVLKTDKGKYLLQLWRSTLDNDELISNAITSQVLILVFLFIVFLGINWWVSRTLWKPFYSTIKTLQLFRASTGEKPVLQHTPIKEFSELNNSVTGMMEKMMSDFKSQKQFTENASHEMQTPLSVIKAKIELLVQSDKLGETEANLILMIDNAVTKLSRLNKSLLLLTKIENHQFNVEENVSLNQVINDSLALFQEHIEEKKIKVIKITSTEIKLHINPDLCLVLINNILQNAIRHNIQNGVIEIDLWEKQLTICNTGQTRPLNASKIFERFQKNTSSVESLGLGLAIAKEIADTNGLLLQYKYVLNKHYFILGF